MKFVEKSQFRTNFEINEKIEIIFIHCSIESIYLGWLICYIIIELLLALLSGKNFPEILFAFFMNGNIHHSNSV